jgi:hypothetical protein
MLKWSGAKQAFLLSPQTSALSPYQRDTTLAAKLILSNRSIVIFKVGRELMGFVFFGYKVNEFCISRIKGSLQGFCPWIGDGAGGKASDFVSIIRRGSFKVSAF